MWLEWNIILLSYSYIFTICFPNNSPLLKSLSSAISNFSCFLTSVLNFSLNSATTSFTFYKFFSLSYILCFTINFFYHTEYFTTPLIFLLFNIFSISYFLTSFTQLNKFSSNLTVIIWQTTKILWLIATWWWSQLSNVFIVSLVPHLPLVSLLVLLYNSLFSNTLLWQLLVIMTNNNTSNKFLSRISSGDYRRTQQGVFAELLPYLYKLHMVHAT